jgi:hypothetical protein
MDESLMRVFAGAGRLLVKMSPAAALLPLADFKKRFDWFRKMMGLIDADRSEY